MLVYMTVLCTGSYSAAGEIRGRAVRECGRMPLMWGFPKRVTLESIFVNLSKPKEPGV